MKLILLGAPGCGKGTLGKMIKEKYNVPLISTGDIFRKNIEDETELGKHVKSIMNAGKLVGDDIVVAIVKDRLNNDDCKNGYILDGFPRTIKQAEELDKFAKIDITLLLDVPESVIIDRLTSRRVCLSCNAIYNTNSYKELFCSQCGKELIQRDDDKLETIQKRLDEYNKNTFPLISYYNKQKKLIKVLGRTLPQETFEVVMQEFKKWGK